MARPSFSYRHRGTYTTRILACIAAVLVVCLALVHWWPELRPSPVRLQEVEHRETIDMPVIEPTRQEVGRRLPPPPVAQAPPVEVPDEVVLPEEPLDLTLPDGRLEAGPPARSANAGSDTAGSSTGRPPRPVRLVEPEYTSAAREQGIRARIVVEVLVDAQGRVQDRRIVRRLVLDEPGRAWRPVEKIGYGLEEAALTAAAKWRFRPGRQNGAPVSAYTEVTFSFGI